MYTSVYTSVTMPVEECLSFMIERKKEWVSVLQERRGGEGENEKLRTLIIIGLQKNSYKSRIGYFKNSCTYKRNG